MPKTNVKSHPRKGTRGVKKHSRSILGIDKSVPHNTKKRMTLKQFVKELDLELRHLSFTNTETNKYKELKDFNDLPKELRNKKWDFEVGIDRIPVEGSTEFGYIDIEGRNRIGKKKIPVQTGVDILRGRIIPTKYDTVATYQEISLDSQLRDPIEEWDKVARKKITNSVNKAIKTNYPNPNNTIKINWETRSRID